MNSLDWDHLHAQAAKAKPSDLYLSSSRYLIGIILPSADLHQLDEFDFLWMQGPRKTDIKKLHNSYVQRQEPDVEIELQFNGEILQPEVTMRSLNYYSDNLIILRAVPKHLALPTPQPRSSPELPAKAVSRQVPLELESPSLAAKYVSPKTKTPHRRETGSATTMPPLMPISADQERRPSPSWGPQRDQEMPSVEVSTRRPSHVPHYFHSESASSESTSSLDFVPPSRSKRYLARPETEHNPPFLPVYNPLPLNMNPRQPPIPPTLGQPQPLVHPTWAPIQHVPTSVPNEHKPVKAEPASPRSFPVEAERDVSPENSFDPAQIFNRDPSPEVDDTVKPTDRFIREIMEQQTPEILEAGVAKAKRVLESLQSTFLRYAAESQDASSWAEATRKLCSQAEPTRTVVGVVGNTGAGKSSVINALLDEERLVPTNCMRACTAVVTSISMNTSNDPHAKYRAEIEFIKKSDWEEELAVLMTEFLNENGMLSSDAKDPNSDAGVAWSKFHATYPKIHKEDLGDWTVEKLMAETTVLNCLGTTKYIKSAFPDRFYSELQKYVDSKEKSTGKKDKDKEKKKLPGQIEYWALIKEVRIYTKSDALSTGAVIVDLPGVQDSNAARASVAAGYMKQCTGLWIVAPITRAVDDKAAKNLLGDAFKRQLKYDGNYSSVTFICSKTDDISITEATDSLELEDKMTDLEQQQRAYKREIKSGNENIESLKDSIAVYREVIEEADKDLETWEQLQDDADAGEKVYAPEKASKKRKRGRPKKNSRKRQEAEDSDVEYVSSDAEESSVSDTDSDDDGCQAPRAPLTVREIKAKIDELRQSKKSARQERAILIKQIPDLKAKVRELQEKLDDVRGDMSSVCIEGRNQYSKGAIQQDFAAGIRELDMQAAEEEDEEAFNPDEDRRDYDEVARSLPVFCVSSRAYQKMCGRLKKDENVPGFQTPESTEMPQLQAHCKKLTEAGRVQACRKFLLNLVQQLTTYTLWASNDGTGLKMTDEDKQKQVKYLQKRLGELDKGLEQAVTACLRALKNALHNQIFDRFPELIEDAIKVAPDIAHRWGYKSEGGLHYSTYKAVVRRNGVYHSTSAGHRDFNADLMDVILKRLATGWERAFQDRLPKAFNKYVTDSAKVLRMFYDTIEERARQNGVGLANLAMLKGSIPTYEALFQELNNKYLAEMTEAQREANREFVPTIATMMETVYTLCANECGTGSYKRMKDHMTTYVEAHRHQMFKSSTESVGARLDTMCKKLGNTMSNGADDIFAKMRADYLHVLGGVQVSQEVMSKQEKALRVEIRALLNTVDEQFERVARGELDEEKPAVDDAVKMEEVDDAELSVSDEDADSVVGASSGSRTVPETIDGVYEWEQEL